MEWNPKELTRELSAILPWYRNQAHGIVKTYVIPTLVAAAEQGYWPKGASRKVKAALNKTHRTATAGARDAAVKCGVNATIDIDYGHFDRAPRHAVTIATLLANGLPVGKAFLDWVASMTVVAKLVEELDATRPKPAYVFAAVSPTVHANVRSAMGIDFTTVAAPLITWEKVTFTSPVTGKVSYEWVPTIHWPEGTRHDTSKFAFGSRAGNQQCHACGHAIKNNWNWVPLVATTADGPVSLFVGKDCAETLFGAKLSAPVVFTTATPIPTVTP